MSKTLNEAITRYNGNTNFKADYLEHHVRKRLWLRSNWILKFWVVFLRWFRLVVICFKQKTKSCSPRGLGSGLQDVQRSGQTDWTQTESESWPEQPEPWPGLGLNADWSTCLGEVCRRQTGVHGWRLVVASASLGSGVTHSEAVTPRMCEWRRGDPYYAAFETRSFETRPGLRLQGFDDSEGQTNGSRYRCNRGFAPEMRC